MLCTIDPGFGVESDGVHDERVSFPLADRISHVGGRQILGMIPPVGINLPDQVLIFVDDQYALGQCNNFEWIWLCPHSGHAWGNAEHDQRVFLRTGFNAFFAPGQERSAAFEGEIGPYFALREPYSRKIASLF